MEMTALSVTRGYQEDQVFDVHRKRRELLISLSSSRRPIFLDWRLARLGFAVVGLAYHASTLLLSSMLFLTLAGSAFSALRKS
jgi:hypothetical protein